MNNKLNFVELISLYRDTDKFIKLIEELLKSAGSNRVVFILFYGQYETGKSSIIAKLLNSKEVRIGNGISEETKGLVFYQPISINELCNRFGIKTIQDDNTEVVFIDSHGTGGFDNDYKDFYSDEMLHFLGSLSSLVVTTNKKTDISDDSFNKILEVHDKGFNDAVINYPYGDNFNKTKSIFEQSEEFNQEFKKFVEKIIERLNICKNESFIDCQEAISVLQGLLGIRKEKKSNVEEYKDVLERAKKSAHDRLCESIINEALKKLKGIHDQFLSDLKEKDILKFPTYDKDQLIQEVKDKMNEKNLTYDEGVNCIMQQIKSYQSQIYEQTISKQKNYIITIAKNKLEGIINELKNNIQTCQNQELNEILPEDKKDDIENEIDKDIDDISKQNNIFKVTVNEIKSEINQLISKEFDELQEFTYKHFYSSFIEKYINRINRKDPNLSCSCNTDEIINTFRDDFQKQIPRIVRDHKVFNEIMKEFDVKINENLSKIKDNSEIYGLINQIYEREIKNIEEKHSSILIDIFPSFDEILRKVFKEVDNYCNENSLSNKHNLKIKKCLGKLISLKNQELYNKSIDIFIKNKIFDIIEKEINEIFKNAFDQIEKSDSIDFEKILSNGDIPITITLKNNILNKIDEICEKYQLSKDEINNRFPQIKESKIIEEISNRARNVGDGNMKKMYSNINEQLNSIFKQESQRIEKSKFTELEEILPKETITEIMNKFDKILNEFEIPESVIPLIKKYFKSIIEEKYQELQSKATTIAQNNKEELNKSINKESKESNESKETESNEDEKEKIH